MKNTDTLNKIKDTTNQAHYTTLQTDTDKKENQNEK